MCSGFSLKKAVPGRGHTSGHASDNEHLKNGTVQGAERNSCRCLCDVSLGLRLTGKISHLFTWKEEFSLSQGSTWLYLEVLCTDRYLVHCRLPVDISPLGEWQTNGDDEVSSLGTRGSFLCAWAMDQAYFFLDLLCEFGVSFLPKSTKS